MTVIYGSACMDHATANLPSRDFDATLAFYAPLGFEIGFRDEGWMILTRGGVTLEFFSHPDLTPGDSWFSCCLRLDDVETFIDLVRAAGVPAARRGIPRFHPPEAQGDMTIGALIDPDGTLLRVIEN